MTNEILISITGKVQGVFFRAEAQEKAWELGLTGWIQNESDGTITACAQGPEDKLAQFVEWCKIGPRGADVDDVVITARNEPAVLMQFFEIKH